jgi:hypothetical protein
VENRKLINSLVVTLLILAAGLAAFSPPALASRAQVLFTDVSGTPVDSIRVGDTIFVTVIDPDENRDSDEVELIGAGNAWFVEDELGNRNPVIGINVPHSMDMETSDPGMGSVPLILQETGANTGVFRSQFGLRVVQQTGQADVHRLSSKAGPFVKNDGLISVYDQDELVVHYQDPSDPTDVAIDLAMIQDTRAEINITDRNGTPVELWNVGDDIFVTLRDADEDIDPVTIDTVPNITLRNERTLETEMLLLVETGPNTGVFMNPDGITLIDLFGTELQSDLRLNVLDKDTIAVFYRTPKAVGGVTPPPPAGNTRTDTVQNGSITFARTVPTNIAPGDEFDVTVTITANVAVDLAAYTDTLPNGFTLVSGKLTDFASNLAAGQTLTRTYRVRAGATAGTFNITGSAKATGEDGLNLSSALEVAAAASRAASFARVSNYDFAFTPERVDMKENNLASASREFPDRVATGETFTITVTVTAKVALELAAVNTQLPGNFRLASGSLTAFATNLAAGQSFTNTYQVTAGSTEGSFVIDGTVRAKPVGGPSEVLTITSNVTVGAGTPAIAGISPGDPNDPHDFAMDWAKIAEANPATVTLTDVNGAEKTTFKFNEDLHVTVRDEDEDFSSDKVDIVMVDVVDPNGGMERLTLLETGVSTGVFRNPDFIRIRPMNAPECAAERAGGDVPGIICAYNKDAFYVRYADDLFSTLDPFDIAFDTGLIYSCETFTPDGGNKISFVNDQGNPIDRIIKGRQIFVKLEDCDANEFTDSIDKLGSAFNNSDITVPKGEPVIRVLDRHTGDYEDIILEETGPNTGLFMSRLGLTLERPTNGVHTNDGILQMEDRDTIEVHYYDPNSPTDYTAAMLRISPQPGGVSGTTQSSTRFTDSRGRSVSEYELGDSVFVTVNDGDKNRSPGTADMITGAVTLENVRTGQSVELDLSETEPDSGAFISEAVVIGEPGTGADLEVEAGDVLRATYTDPSDLADTSEATSNVAAGVLTVTGYFNSPNPFSGQTAFTVDGSGVQNTSVKVWDLSGQMVFENSASGSKVTWDGTDSNGDQLANGVYLYIVTATGKDRSESSSVRKLVVLR